MSALRFATQTPPELVDVLRLGPDDSNAKRIGYWRSVKSPDEAPEYVQTLGVAPMVPGGPYAYQRESTTADLCDYYADKIRITTRDGRTTANVRGRIVFAGDVLGWQGADDDRTFTMDQLKEYLDRQDESAQNRFQAWQKLPWPGDYTDATMPNDERQRIAERLGSDDYQIVARYCGSSPSRLTPMGVCGGAERSNGEWVWPVGLVHYVLDHGLRLDPEFLRSIGAEQ